MANTQRQFLRPPHDRPPRPRERGSVPGRSVISTLFRKPDQVLQPWMFGDFETKAVCLWLRGLPLLVPTYRTPDECREALGLPAGTKPADRIHKMPPGPDRAELRSETYPGIARAKAAQWGGTATLATAAA